MIQYITNSRWILKKCKYSFVLSADIKLILPEHILHRINGHTHGTPHGKITQLYVWSRKLQDIEMENFTANCSFNINKTGIFIIKMALARD